MICFCNVLQIQAPVSRTGWEHVYLTPWERGVGNISALLQRDSNSLEWWKWKKSPEATSVASPSRRETAVMILINRPGRSKWVFSTLQLQCEFFKLSHGENNSLWEVKLTWQPWWLPLVGQIDLPQSHHNGNPSHQKHHPVQDLCQLWEKEKVKVSELYPAKTFLQMFVSSKRLKTKPGWKVEKPYTAMNQNSIQTGNRQNIWCL